MKSILLFSVVLAVASAATIQRTQRDTKEPSEEAFFENVVAVMKTAADTTKANIEKFTTEISEKNPELQKMLDSAKSTIQKSVDDFNKQFPDAQEKLKELQAKGQEALSVVMKEAEKTYQNVSDQLKTAMETKN